MGEGAPFFAAHLLLTYPSILSPVKRVLWVNVAFYSTCINQYPHFSFPSQQARPDSSHKGRNMLQLHSLTTQRHTPLELRR